MKGNNTLLVLILIMVINAMGFGIIIPVLYPYAKTLGINEQSIGWLLASFSIAQFFATPILGKWSDKIGRKSVLIVCLIGTAISFVMFAEAGSVFMLFAARILDGITGGNISVAQAVIADTTTKENRTKAFGYLAAALGVGFLLGPVVGGLLSGFSPQTPFLAAAGLALLGVLVTLFFFKESNRFAEESSGSAFMSPKEMIASVRKPYVGRVFIIGLLTATANFAMFTGFQTYNTDVLLLTAVQMGVFFGAFAIATVITQAVFLKPLLKAVPSKMTILGIALSVTALAMIGAGFSFDLNTFAASLILYAFFNSLRDPMLQSLVSEHTAADEQGRMLGLNQSFLSIGQILGPIIAGYVSIWQINNVFFAAAAFLFLGWLLVVLLPSPKKKS